MSSTNDTTILTMLSRYPDIPADEADRYIAKIQNEENIPLCHAILGRISRDELTEDARQTFDEFKRWSDDRTTRLRQQQFVARHANRETELSLKMNQLHQRGVISDEVMVLYGISGPLPDRDSYSGMTTDEKRVMWEERMSNRFGPNWRERFSQRVNAMPFFTWRQVKSDQIINWQREGF